MIKSYKDKILRSAIYWADSIFYLSLEGSLKIIKVESRGKQFSKEESIILEGKGMGSIWQGLLREAIYREPSNTVLLCGSIREKTEALRRSRYNWEHILDFGLKI